jgi:hypothetical protein
MKHLLVALILTMSTCEVNAQTAADSLFLTANTLASQDMTSRQKPYKQTKYWRRYKVSRAVGWSMFGVGVAGWIGCAYGNVFDYFTNAHYGDSNKKTWNALSATGLGLTVCSIPVLVYAYTNRSKAKKSVRVYPVCTNIKTDIPSGGNETVPAVGVCLNF